MLEHCTVPCRDSSEWYRFVSLTNCDGLAFALAIKFEEWMDVCMLSMYRSSFVLLLLLSVLSRDSMSLSISYSSGISLSTRWFGIVVVVVVEDKMGEVWFDIEIGLSLM